MNKEIQREITKCLDNTFIKINGLLDGKKYKTIDLDEAIALSEDFIKAYENIDAAVDSIENGFIFYKYWDNTITTMSLILSRLIDMDTAAETCIDNNFIKFVNSKMQPIIDALKDLTTYKLYLMALEDVYTLKNSRPVIIKLIKLEIKLINTFRDYNELAASINKDIDQVQNNSPDMEMLALVDYNNLIDEHTYNKVLGLVGDQNFVTRPYYYIHITISRMLNISLIYPPYCLYF